MKKQITAGVLVAAILVTAAAAFNVAYLVVWRQFTARLTNFTQREADYRKLDEIRAYLDGMYIDEYDTQLLMEGAARGMLEALPDGGSYYMSAQEYAESLDDTASPHVGIGVNAYYDEDSGMLRVVEVYKGSPAEKSGICFYDQILFIDNVSIAQLGQENIDGALRGEAGTTVSLTVEHGDGSVETVDVVRAQSTEQAMEYTLLDDGVGYIRIPTFEARVDVQFEGAVEALTQQGARALVLDVRFNPGGRQDVLCRILDRLLPEGVILQWVNKQGQTEVVSSDADCVTLPMAVLVNGHSFTAAEFLAAALQEYGAAVIVGEQTPGKCYAQTVCELSDGSAVTLPTAEYMTPGGRTLHGTGVTPDVSASLTPGQVHDFDSLSHSEDGQLIAAIGALGSGN